MRDRKMHAGQENGRPFATRSWQIAQSAVNYMKAVKQAFVCGAFCQHRCE
jgi:hypothetical protein